MDRAGGGRRCHAVSFLALALALAVTLALALILILALSLTLMAGTTQSIPDSSWNPTPTLALTLTVMPGATQFIPLGLEEMRPAFDRFNKGRAPAGHATYKELQAMLRSVGVDPTTKVRLNPNPNPNANANANPNPNPNP